MDKVLIEQQRLESQAGRGFQTLLKTIFKKVWIEEKDSHIFAHTKQQQIFNHMKAGQIITGTIGDKKDVQGEVLAIDIEKQRIQVKWPKGYMKTWVKITSVK